MHTTLSTVYSKSYSQPAVTVVNETYVHMHMRMLLNCHLTIPRHAHYSHLYLFSGNNNDEEKDSQFLGVSMESRDGRFAVSLTPCSYHTLQTRIHTYIRTVFTLKLLWLKFLLSKCILIQTNTYCIYVRWTLIFITSDRKQCNLLFATKWHTNRKNAVSVMQAGVTCTSFVIYTAWKWRQ